jgi:hypothetical protein
MEEENEEKEIIKLKTEDFIPWLDQQFSKKFEISLEGLRVRFIEIYNLFKIIFEQILLLDHTLMEESKNQNTNISYDKEYNYQDKPLIDNMIMLLNMILKEFTECLDLEFVEHFFRSVEERLKLFRVHFHQILHFHHSEIKIEEKINKYKKIIDNALNLIPNSVIELQKRAEMSLPLLKYIKDCKTMFKTPLKKLKEEINFLAEDKSYEEYESLMDDMKNRSQSSIKLKLDFINKMIDLVKVNSQIQFELNKMLKPYYSMSSLVRIKGKGKKFFNENLNSNERAKILNYANLLSKSDFCNNFLPNLDFNEVIHILKCFETQSNLVSEYKKTLIKGIEEYKLINPVEFEIIIEKYKSVLEEVNNYQESAMKYFENIKMNKEFVTQIKNIVKKYTEFQNGVYHYQSILELFQKIRNLVTKFCYSEFNLKVEIICEYNL